jgi:hypothetical protein
MIQLHNILIILLIHWISDFVLQTQEMSSNKYKNNGWLFYHVSVYSLSSLILWAIFLLDFSIINFCIFYTITFATHFLTDYITSRITSKLYKEKDYHNFFVVIGIDQFIHTAQLLSTYILIA